MVINGDVMQKETIQKIKQIEGELNTHVIGREEAVKTLLLALSSQEHILILGKHGEAKSLMADLVTKTTKLKSYSKQLHNETTLKEILGMLNPIEYQKGKLDLIKTDFWDCNIAYFDEFLRGRSEFLDFLLEIMIERRCSKSVLGNVDLPLLSVIAVSNPLTEEYNTERLDLALKDRFSFILNFNHLIEDKPEDIQKVLELKDNDLKAVPISVSELKDIRGKALDSVKVDNKFIFELFSKLKADGFVFSTRFIRKYSEICRVHAFINQRAECKEEDYLFVSSVMLRNRFEALTLAKIDDVLDETLVLVGYKELIDKINELNTIDTPKVFIEKSIEIIETTKEEYPEYPEKLKKAIDILRDRLKEALLNNIDSITPTIVKKLDTEEFKKIIKTFIDSNTVQTKFLKEKCEQLDKAEKIIKSTCKNCDVLEEKSDNYKKIIIKPKIEETKSFKEIEKIKTILEDEEFLSSV